MESSTSPTHLAHALCCYPVAATEVCCLDLMTQRSSRVEKDLPREDRQCHVVWSICIEELLERGLHYPSLALP